MPNLIIGSRGSKLALWQANWIKNRLEKTHPSLVVSIEIIKTTGDKLTEASLAQIGGKGVFTKEIEDALINRQIDLAVHSLKDLPTTLPDGLHLAAITEREDVRDALIVSKRLHGSVWSIGELPEKARVGTSSLRRAAQLRHLRPDLQIVELRGNVDTRLKKVDEGDYDAIVLASAGLIRLGYSESITAQIDVSEMLTAVGQGALGIEARIDDQRTNLLLDPLNHWPTRHATQAERALLRELGGGCAVPIAALGRIRKDRSDGRRSGKLILDALVAGVDGKKIIRSQASGRPTQAEEIGGRLARQLADAGARELLPRIGGEMKAVAQASQAAAAVEPAIAVQTKKARPSPGIETGSEKHRARSSKKPLAGARVIVTRAVKQSGELIKALEMFGAEALACPTIEIREPSSWERLDRALIHLSWYDWLIFTSANGVEYFLRRMDELGHRRVELAPHRVCAVGRKTAEKLKEENIQVDLMPEKFTAEALAEELVKRFGARRQLRGARMLLPTSKSARDVIRPAMEKIGIYVEVVEAYRTVPPASSSAEIPALAPDAKADYIVFTSPSTIANLAALLETDDLAARLDGARVACIGPVTAAAAQAYGLQVHIQPEEHTGEAIVKALVKDAEEERLRK